MKNICCLARHVLCKFYGKGESVKEYAIKIAKRYEVDVNDLKQEIINQRKIK